MLHSNDTFHYTRLKLISLRLASGLKVPSGAPGSIFYSPWEEGGHVVPGEVLGVGGLGVPAAAAAAAAAAVPEPRRGSPASSVVPEEDQPARAAPGLLGPGMHHRAKRARLIDDFFFNKKSTYLNETILFS